MDHALSGARAAEKEIEGANMRAKPVLFLVTFMAVVPVAAQNPSANKAPAKTWTPPRTPDGQPDLQGVWTNATITPFERPPELAAKPVLTEKEAAELEKQAAGNRVDRPPKPGDVGNYNQVWFDSGTKVVSTLQTSLVVEPADGRVPVKPSAEAKRDYDLAHVTDSYEYMSLWDRCITRGVPGGMFPAGYNNAYRIVQSAGYVVILYEMIHSARVIPVDGSPHLPSNVHLWDGDSRGHWEGNTLVVDVANYSNKGWIATSASTGRIKGIPQTETTHVVERFTRTAPDTIMYEVKIEDPNVYDAPWKVAIPLVRDDSYQILEYACQEGNRSIENILTGGRVADEAAKQGSK
jgi:hypothetical protein